jgi:hypothetical protein
MRGVEPGPLGGEQPRQRPRGGPSAPVGASAPAAQPATPHTTPPAPPRDALVVITPNVVREARAQFGCEKLPGGFLEPQGAAGSARDHWDARMYQGAIMIASTRVRAGARARQTRSAARPRLLSRALAPARAPPRKRPGPQGRVGAHPKASAASPPRRDRRCRRGVPVPLAPLLPRARSCAATARTSWTA